MKRFRQEVQNSMMNVGEREAGMINHNIDIPGTSQDIPDDVQLRTLSTDPSNSFQMADQLIALSPSQMVVDIKNLDQMQSNQLIQADSDQNDDNNFLCQNNDDMEAKISPVAKRRCTPDLLVNDVGINLKHVTPHQSFSSSTSSNANGYTTSLNSELSSDLLNSSPMFEVSSAVDGTIQSVDSSTLYFASQTRSQTAVSPLPLDYTPSQRFQHGSVQEFVPKIGMLKKSSSDSNSTSTNDSLSWSGDVNNTDPFNYSRRSQDFSQSSSSTSSMARLSDTTNSLPSRLDHITEQRVQNLHQAELPESDAAPQDLSSKSYITNRNSVSHYPQKGVLGNLVMQERPVDITPYNNVIDLTEERTSETATPSTDNKLDLIRRQYQTSCDHFTKVCTLLKFLDEQKVKLEARRQSLQKTLIRLKLMYKISKLQNDALVSPTTIGKPTGQVVPVAQHSTILSNNAGQNSDNFSVACQPKSRNGSASSEESLPVDYSFIAQDEVLISGKDDQLFAGSEYIKLVPAHEKTHSLQLMMEEQIQPALAHVHKVDLSMYTYMYRPDDDDEEV